MFEILGGIRSVKIRSRRIPIRLMVNEIFRSFSIRKFINTDIYVLL